MKTETAMLKTDTSFLGMLKSVVYVFPVVYGWLSEKGIDPYVFYALLGLQMLDMFLGWGKSSVVKTLENPTSKKAKKGILAKIVMFVIPVVAGVVWGVFDKENALKVVNTLLAALVVAEGYSCVANSYSIYTGEELAEFDAVTYVIKKLAERIRNLLTKIMG